MTIDVVIPNYNGAPLIKKNLSGVLAGIKKYKGKVIITDDCSSTQDYEELEQFVSTLKEKGEPVELFRNKKNLGFGSNVDRGVSESKADFIVLLNTDVTPEDNFLESPLSDFVDNPNLFGVGMMDRSIEGGATVLRGRGEASWKRGFLVHRKGDVNKSETFWISGGSSVIRRDLFEKLGGFDPLYNPFYWEDIDLSYRAKKAGFDLMFESKSIVVHRHDEGSIKKQFKASRIKTTAYRNQFIFVWKNITDPGLILSHFFFLPYHLLSAIIRVDSQFLLGFIYALLRLPTILSHRHQQLKSYKLKDSDLFNNQ